MIYVAALMLVVGVALFVAAPLLQASAAARGVVHDLEGERLEHERALAIQALGELNFDREMGKLSEADYQAQRQALEERALAAMSALKALRPESRATPVLVAASRGRKVGKRRRGPVRFCPRCGARAGPGNFCAQCGASLGPKTRAAGRAE